MKLLKLLEVTRRFGADEHFRLYMPNGGEDGVLIGWRMDWPENHHIEFRGPPYSEWQSGGSDFERVHDRLAGMRATVLHHDSVVDVIPGMEEFDDIAKAINDKGLPEWDADRAFNESAQGGVTIRYLGQPKVAVKPARASDDVLMMIPTAALDAGFGKDGESFYVGPGGSGAAIGKRYAGFQDWISKHDTYELPEVYVNENGKLSFTNGRHRYAVLRDAGVDPMPVAMARSGVPNAQKFLKGVIRESLNEMADPQMIRDAAPKALARLKKQIVGDAKSSESRVRIAFQKDTGIETGDPKWDEAFAVWKEGYAQRIVGKAIGVLNKGMEFRDGKLLVFRMIEAGDNFLTDEYGATFSSRGLGQYWSWDKESAYAWRGDGGGVNWLIIGAVDPAHVNWDEILYANAHPAVSHEKEINIPEGVPIKILDIKKDGESVDPSMYGGRGRTLMASLGESQLDDDYKRGRNDGYAKGIVDGVAYYKRNFGKANKEQPKYQNHHVRKGRITKDNAYEKSFEYGYQDGYYDGVTGMPIPERFKNLSEDRQQRARDMGSIGESRLDEALLMELQEIGDPSQMNSQELIFRLMDNNWKKIGTDSAYSDVYGKDGSPWVVKILKVSRIGKTSTRFQCAMQWYRYCLNNWQSNPHLPRIPFVKTLRATAIGDDGQRKIAKEHVSYVVMLERLEDFYVDHYEWRREDPLDNAIMFSVMAAVAGIYDHKWMNDEDVQRVFPVLLRLMPEEDLMSLFNSIKQHAWVDDSFEFGSEEWFASFSKTLLRHGGFSVIGLMMERGIEVGVKYGNPMAIAMEQIHKAGEDNGCEIDLHLGNVMVRPSTGELVITDPVQG